MKPLQILILDDETSILDRLGRFLRNEGYTVHTTSDPVKAFQVIAKEKIDMLFCDIMMPQSNGLDVLKKVKEIDPELEVIMISAYGDMDTVIQAMRSGAVDFIRKPFGLAEVELAIERTSKYIQLQSRLKSSEDHRSLISRQLESMIEKEFIGTSKAIQGVLDLALRSARDREVHILITGENGTGKEVVARIIHYASERKKMPFYPVNSAAIPETLLESEFFGHMKGSFTDARENKKGCFELANGGTLFLDEISEMPIALQAKLLRALEEKKIKPIGSDREVLVDVRIISATNKDIQEVIREKRFRLDLYHRINTINIHIPPLRERPEDIEPLFRHFVHLFAGNKNLPVPEVDPVLLEALKHYPFPGNVRELKNMVERAMILINGNKLSTKHFHLSAHDEHSPHKTTDASISNHVLSLEDAEINHIREVLKLTGNNKTRASQLLGIPRYTLIRKMKKHGIR
jgi:DNA-binding NtrC family response regulator